MVRLSLCVCALAVAAAVPADEDYVFQNGYLHAPDMHVAPADRDDMWSAAMTIDEAKALCSSEETCTGFSFLGADDTASADVWFMNDQATAFENDNAWGTYAKCDGVLPSGSYGTWTHEEPASFAPAEDSAAEEEPVATDELEVSSTAAPPTIDAAGEDCCQTKSNPCSDGNHGCNPYSTICQSLIVNPDEIIYPGQYQQMQNYFCKCLMGFEPNPLDASMCCEGGICPTDAPTAEPTYDPTAEPTEEPSFAPSAEPTFQPSEMPTEEPTFQPSEMPTEEPSVQPTEEPTLQPSAIPTYRPTKTDAPTFAPTVEPTLCEEYCCQDQLVLWHIPGSESHKCDDYGEPVATGSDIEGCHKLCVQETTCLYFSVTDDGACYHGEFCGGEMKEHAEKLPEDPQNPGGIYQLYCAMSDSIEKTCTGRPSFDKVVGFLTYCFDKCEGSDECRYFVYREHTSQCQLFDSCREFDDAGDDQALVYMMHEEAFGKDAGAIKGHHRDNGFSDHAKGKETHYHTHDGTLLTGGTAAELSASTEQARSITTSSSKVAVLALSSVGVMMVALVAMFAVRARRRLVQASLATTDALSAQGATL